MTSDVNQTTHDLKAYPMEKLFKIKSALKEKNKKFYDFGVGDPKLPLWTPAIDALKESASLSLGYPSIAGIPELLEAGENYLKRRFSLKPSKERALIPTKGSKEAIFHIALSLVGRKGRKTIAYPSPGYPVYHSSALFAGGKPFAIELNEENNYLVEPWKLSPETISDLCALWVNYPHNPSGKSVDNTYWQKLITWCHEHDVVLLSDESYCDMYHTDLDSPERQHLRPNCPLFFSSDRVLSFFSLSKRSGFTGLRSGFVAGDPKILKPHLKARANFGLASPLCIQKAASLTWNDDEHVEKRRATLSKRLDIAYDSLEKLGLIKEKPIVPFYLWLKIPENIKKDDIKFCLDLAEEGFIATPGSWLDAKSNQNLRLSLTLEPEEMTEAFKILTKKLH